MTKFDDISTALTALENSAVALASRVAAFVSAQATSVTPTQAQAIQDRITAVQTATDATAAAIPTP